MTGANGSNRAPAVGFVVIGRNEGERLMRCLTSLGPAKYPVVYADSASMDGSAERARALGAEVVELEDDLPLTAARGRMAGLDRLRHLNPHLRYVHFIDGDCILQPGWLDQARTFLEAHPDVAAVCGQRFEAHPETSLYNQLIDQEWNTPVGEALACGGDALMRIEALVRVGGFDTNLRAGEEPELCARLRQAGWCIWRLDGRMTEHDAGITRLGQWWKRALRSGYGYAQVLERTKSLPQPLYGDTLKRVIFWAAAMPMLWVLAALVTGRALVLLGIPLAYAAQVVRLAVRRGPTRRLSWVYAALMVVTKFAELAGAIRYWRRSESKRLTSYR